MKENAIIFACANPTPEIFPEEAREGGAAVIATGRSDFPNQINNVLAFPGIFRGTFDVRASDINDEMKIAAAEALAGLILEEELSADYIIPEVKFPHLLNPYRTFCTIHKIHSAGTVNFYNFIPYSRRRS
mgnify:CR=1 FL=1